MSGTEEIAALSHHFINGQAASQFTAAIREQAERPCAFCGRVGMAACPMCDTAITRFREFIDRRNYEPPRPGKLL